MLIWILTALPFAFVCCVLFVLPHLSRRTQFFAVTVPPEFRQSLEARRVINRYRAQVAVHCCFGALLFAFVVAYNAPNWLPLALLWPTAGSMFAVFAAHRQSVPYAVPAPGIRQASLRPRQRSGVRNLLTWLGPFGILAAAGAYTGLHWNQIPARFPIHWSFDNAPNGWAVRSISGVYGPLGMGLFVCFLMWFLSWQISSNSRGSTAMRNLTVGLLTAVSYLMAALFAWLTVTLPLGHGAPSATSLALIMGTAAILIGTSVVLGLRAKGEPEPSDGSGQVSQSVLGLSDNSADSNWIGGLVYFNPDDPALFVEKRIGIGYDLNFGNPASWAFFGFIVVLPVALMMLSKL